MVGISKYNILWIYLSLVCAGDNAKMLLTEFIIKTVLTLKLTWDFA